MTVGPVSMLKVILICTLFSLVPLAVWRTINQYRREWDRYMLLGLGISVLTPLPSLLIFEPLAITRSRNKP